MTYFIKYIVLFPMGATITSIYTSQSETEYLEQLEWYRSDDSYIILENGEF